jgi:hypothetical protein
MARKEEARNVRGHNTRPFWRESSFRSAPKPLDAIAPSRRSDHIVNKEWSSRYCTGPTDFGHTSRLEYWFGAALHTGMHLESFLGHSSCRKQVIQVAHAFA